MTSYIADPTSALHQFVAGEVHTCLSVFSRLGVKASIKLQEITASDTGNFVRYPIEILGKVSTLTAIEDDLAVALTAYRSEVLDGNVEITLRVHQPKLVIELPYPFELSALTWEVAPLDRVRAHQAILGMDYSTLTPKPIILDYTDPVTSNVLVTGTTGSGKTKLLTIMILSLCLKTPPSQLQIILIDPKGETDWLSLGRLPHVTLISADNETGQRAVEGVFNELKARALVEDKRRVITIIDEFAEFAIDQDDIISNRVSRMAAMGRAKCINLVIATQKALVRAVDTLILANLPIKVGGKVNTPKDSEVAMGVTKVGCEYLPGRGSFYLRLNGPIQRIQGYTIGESVDQVIDEIIALWQDEVPYRINFPSGNDIDRVTQVVDVVDLQAQQLIDTYGDNLFKSRTEGGPTKTELSQLLFSQPNTGTNPTRINRVLERVKEIQGA